VTVRVEVRESRISDVYRLAGSLREGDAAEVAALGFDPRAALRRSFRDAVLRRSYFVDGELAAMSGLCGAFLSDIGEPYLLTAPVVERAKVSFLRHARASVAEMLEWRMRLEGHVAASYVRACRLLTALGFTLTAPEPLGPNGALFQQYSLMRADAREAA
jgi:hypothetical protein